MNKILSLTKVLYKANKNNSGKMKKSTKYICGLLIAGYLFFIFSSFWSLMIKPLNEIDMAQTFISLIILIGIAFIFSINIAYVPNVLYFSKNTDMLFTLPLKPKELFSSKLLIIYLYNLMITTMIVFPGFIAYGSITNSGVLFYLYSIITTFLLPIIPIALITIFYTIIVQFFKITKYQSTFKVFTTIFLIVIIMVFEFNMNANMNLNGEYNAKYLLQIKEDASASGFAYGQICNNIFENIGSIFSIISLITFILINFACAYILISFFDKLYIKGVSYNMETANHPKKLEKSEKKNSQYLALIKREIKILLRTSTYLIQCVIPAFFMPIVIFFMNYSNYENFAESLLLNKVSEKIFISLIFVYFSTITNKISATAISRSGKNEYEFLKSLPLSRKKVINAKVVPGILTGFVLILVGSVYFAKLFNLNSTSFVIILAVNLILNVLENYIQIFIDMKHPKLTFENETAVVKQNINIFISYIISVIIIVLLISAYFLLEC